MDEQRNWKGTPTYPWAEGPPPQGGQHYDGPSVEDVREIPRVLNEYDEGLARLEKALTILVQRLKPLLAQSEDKSGVGQPMKPYRSEVAARLAVSNHKLNELTNSVALVAQLVQI